MGTITMLASGKDGVGKSTSGVFIGAALARRGERTLVIELDSGLRSIDVISGTFGRLIYDINDVLSGTVEPQKAIVESPIAEGLEIMSAPFNSSILPVEDFIRLTNLLSEEYEHILIDAAASPGALFSAASCAMRAIIVTVADPVSIRNSKHVFDQLEDYSINNIRLIINRLVPARVLSGIVPNLDFVVDSIGAQLIGVIPESSDIAMASAGVAALSLNSVSGQVFHHIAERMCNNDLPLIVQ